jgi:hypothetical protein
LARRIGGSRQDKKTDTLPDYEADAVLMSYPKRRILSDWRKSSVLMAIAWVLSLSYGWHCRATT